MAVTPGARLGPYEIVALLGAGAMGEVYRARDTRLGRDVAIKVLPSAFASHADRLRRFEQEARAAGLLNHPNIVAIHDVGVHEGLPYIVCELLEGETLRQRLSDGPLPARKALDYSLQLARALAAAHGKGIVHRDLKPENLFITRDGRLKVLDFGLAKLKQDPVVLDVGAQPTGTASGAVLGTVGYMAPEQVRGEPTDHRCDIFGLGAILYEILAGKRAFRGESAVETMNAILKDEPPRLDDLNPAISPALADIVGRCLDKNPADRFQTAEDLAFSLELASKLARSEPRELARERGFLKSRRVRLSVALTATVMLFALGLFVGRGAWGPTPSGERSVRTDRLTDSVGLEEYPALSPDGRSVAFSHAVEGKRQLWIKLIAGGPPLQLTGDPVDHLFPRWSADASSIVYFTPPLEGETAGSIWEVPALGGPPRRIAGSLGGADISPDGRHLAFFRMVNGRIDLVISDRDGSNAKAVAQPETGYSYRTPRWSPDGQSLAYERVYYGADDIFVVSAEAGSTRQVTRDDGPLSGFAWMPDGASLLFSSARGRTIGYLPTFRLWSLGLDGDRRQELTFDEASYVYPDVARDGTIVTSRLRMQSDVWRYPIDGSGAENVRRGERITRQTGQVRTPSVSPEGARIVYLSDTGGHGNLWIMDLQSGEARQITFERDPSVTIGVPVWSPRGEQIAFYHTGPGFIGGYSLINADGSQMRSIIRRGWWACWSPDGRWLHYQDQETPARHLKKMPVDGGPAVTVRTDNAYMPAISPDGQTLYFAVDVPNAGGTLDHEIRYARPETGPSRPLNRIASHRLPDVGRFHPVISSDGRWLALPLTDGVTTNIWALSTADGSFRQLTDFGSRPTFITRRVSWSPDGRFIYAAVGEGDADVMLFDGLQSRPARD